MITLMSGTESGASSTPLAFRSKASRSTRFLLAEPHRRYRPVIQKPIFIVVTKLSIQLITLRQIDMTAISEMYMVVQFYKSF